MDNVSNSVVLNFDMNKFMQAYDKEAFMKTVFVAYLKENPEIVSKALSTYLIMDLVKSNLIDEISSKTKVAIDKILTDMTASSNPYSNPLKDEIGKVLRELVHEHKTSLGNKVHKVVHDGVTEQEIKDKVISVITGKILDSITRIDN